MMNFHLSPYHTLVRQKDIEVPEEFPSKINGLKYDKIISECVNLIRTQTEKSWIEISDFMQCAGSIFLVCVDREYYVTASKILAGFGCFTRDVCSHINTVHEHENMCDVLVQHMRLVCWDLISPEIIEEIMAKFDIPQQIFTFIGYPDIFPLCGSSESAYEDVLNVMFQSEWLGLIDDETYVFDKRILQNGCIKKLFVRCGSGWGFNPITIFRDRYEVYVTHPKNVDLLIQEYRSLRTFIRDDIPENESEKCCKCGHKLPTYDPTQIITDETDDYWDNDRTDAYNVLKKHVAFAEAASQSVPEEYDDFLEIQLKQE